MKLQKQLSKKREKKEYYRYVVNIPSEIIQTSGFKEGDELEANATKGKIELKKK
jgi:bifunctional DNA-binding transcriptional regulator/antitoxin component of YhaV-PrlF toxin-antitoxin module